MVLKYFAEEADHSLLLLFRPLSLQHLLEMPQVEHLSALQLCELQLVQGILNGLLEEVPSACVLTEDVDHRVLLQKFSKDVSLEGFHTGHYFIDVPF